MREIKFRAWYIGQKRMLYQKGHRFEFDGDTDIFRIYTDDGTGHRGEQVANDKHCELMQFTGLKDKNGKEIYEGDILKDIEGIIAEVKYTGRSFRAVAKDGFDSLEDPDENEIIGNIYENKELLK